jgi:hypothetical protein
MGGLILWVPSALAAERMRFLFGFVLGSGMLCVCGLARPLRYQFELHQYRHYINHVISSRIPWNSTAEDGMFKHWSTHHEPFHWRMGNERYIDYAINNNAKVRKWFPPIWDRRFYLAVSGEDAEGVNWKDFGPGMVSVEVDCVYGIVLEDVIALDIKTPAYDVVDNLRDLTKEANAHHGEAFSLIEKFRIPETQKGKNSIVLLY